MRQTQAEVQISTPDGHMLFVRRLESRPKPAEPTLLIAHGASEHGGRYSHILEFFASAGWNVIVGDHRGHGRSSGTRTHIQSFRQYAHDLELIRQHFGLKPESTVVLGHSMGGLIAIRHAQLFPGSTSGVALVSPLLRVKVPIPKHTLALGKFLSVVAPRTRFQTRVNHDMTTRCPQALEKRLNDEYISRSVTARWFFAVQAGIRNAWKDAEKLLVPCLVLQAGSDEIVDPIAPEEWLAKTQCPEACFQNFPDHYHELLNEPDWQQTAMKISEWLGARVHSRPLVASS